MKRAIRAFLLTLLATPVPLLADGGIVATLQGSASVADRGGKTTPASVGTALASGDTVTTEQSARALLRFDDDSIFALGSASRLKVEQFQRRRTDRGGNAIFSLLRGGFRTITGLIGKGKNDTYEVRTGIATIGVRGSGYGAVVCAAQCPRRFPDGLWLKADEGIIIMANAAGRLELRAGQGGYAASETSAPIRVKVTPFDDPAFAADFDFDFDFGVEVEPPRVEPDPAASPS